MGFIKGSMIKFNFFLIAALFLNLVNPILPQGIITVKTDRVEFDLPHKVIFSLSAASDQPIQKVTLLYRSNVQACQENWARQEQEVKASPSVDLSWTWDLNRSQSLPSGAEISWQWKIEDATGQTLLTSTQTIMVEDTHHGWNKLSQKNVTVYWTEGSQAFGQQILDLALASLNRIETKTGLVTDKPVRITVYPSTNALKEAILGEADWIGGVAFPEYGVSLLAITPGEYSWSRAVIPHELAHVVTLQYTDSCMGTNTPVWFIEGLAVFLEGSQDQAGLQYMNKALKENKLTPLNRLNSVFSADSLEALINYTQSGDVIRFMVDSFGVEKMNAMLTDLHNGDIFSDALMKNYELDVNGLDSAWRVSLGYDPLETSDSEPASQNAKPTRTPVPTLAIYSANVQTATLPPENTPTPLPPTATPVPQPTETPPPAAAQPSPTAEAQNTKTNPLPCGAAAIIPMAGAAFLLRRQRPGKAAPKPDHIQ
ncbi:MAG TPA: peptidase MA family metallohydrolase [Anaerolineaceae bacterium]|nr:peptidase MA family metallohydrolase [Anaerolineaceae bacterium]HPN52974.1 peptidase MA family metallohydrolase [Anaerolineaceae bacterium]